MREYIMQVKVGNSPITVQELVRCKDCKWFNDYEVACDLLTGLVSSNSDDYCSKGERKETEDAVH